MAHEIASALVYSKELEQPLAEVWLDWLQKPEATPEEFSRYLREAFPPISISIHTRLLSSCDELIDELAIDGSFLQADYPALYRIVDSAGTLLRNIIQGVKKAARDNEAWESSALPGAFQLRDKIHELEHLKTVLLMNWTRELNELLKHAQPDVDEIISLTDCCISAYLAEPDRDLYALSKKEKSVSLIPTSQTKKLTEDLRQAEKSLRKWLPEGTLSEVNGQIARIEERAEEEEKRALPNA